MSRISSICDDYYVNMILNTEMELPQSRETVLHYFEQVQKKYPSMRTFYTRDKDEHVLEEDKDNGHRRWTTVENRRVSSGYLNPGDIDDAYHLHQFVLDLVPYTLSLSPLDCESLNLTFGFDFTYQGNHNQIVAEALGIPPALERIGQRPGATMIAYEPGVQFALDEDCRLQCRVNIETRTSAYHIRTGTFPEEQISVYLTARRYGSLNPGETFVSVFEHLSEVCHEMLEEYLVESVLQPLQQAISLR